MARCSPAQRRTAAKRQAELLHGHETIYVQPARFLAHFSFNLDSFKLTSGKLLIPVLLENLYRQLPEAEKLHRLNRKNAGEPECKVRFTGQNGIYKYIIS